MYPYDFSTLTFVLQFFYGYLEGLGRLNMDPQQFGDLSVSNRKMILFDVEPRECVLQIIGDLSWFIIIHFTVDSPWVIRIPRKYLLYIEDV